MATFLVARVAWPLYGGRADASVEQDGRWLRRGLALTFLALALLATGTATSWWPQDGGSGGGEAGLVTVQAGNGESVCGTLADTSSGSVRVISDGRAVDVPLQNVASIRSVSGC